MSLNTIAHSMVDSIDVPRSHWTRGHTHKTTFNTGKLVPIYFNEDIIPGTTIKMKLSMVLRMSTPLNPTMDNLVADIFFFRAQKQWYWEHFINQMGYNENGAWSNDEIEYLTPVIKVTEARPVQVNDLLAYMGVPLGAVGAEIDRLGVGMYLDIWNNHFRSQAVHAPKAIDKTDVDLETDGTIETGCGLLPVCRKFDYFSGATPQPQFGEPVEMPLGTQAPINGTITTLSMANGSVNLIAPSDAGVINFYNPGGSVTNQVNFTNTGVVQNTGLITDLTQATAATVNALRLAFATQRILERMALYGTTYRDILKQFGVNASSEALKIPELLSAKSVPINIETVLQQSQTTENSPLGNTGAFSVTADVDEQFIKSFSTHDMIFGLIAVRVDEHTYAQGLPRQLTRRRRYEHFWPEYSHIGNTPIFNYQLFFQGNDQDNEVFGYQEAWQEYMYTPNRVSGEFHPNYAQSLDVWTYVDDYENLPTLSPTWMEESIYNIDRTLAVQSELANQFIADFYFEEDVSAPIPLHRTPGLIDHF